MKSTQIRQYSTPPMTPQGLYEFTTKRDSGCESRATHACLRHQRGIFPTCPFLQRPARFFRTGPQVGPEFDPPWPMLLRTWRSLSRFGPMWPNASDIRPDMVDAGQFVVEFGSVFPTLVGLGLDRAELGPNSAGPALFALGQLTSTTSSRMSTASAASPIAVVQQTQ